MGKKKVLISVIIIGSIIIAALGVVSILINKSKHTYTVLFLDEYGQEIQKAYNVVRPLKWTEADECKTKEYKEALIINSCVGPTRIKLVLKYSELFTRPWIYLLIFLILCGIYVFLNSRQTPKKNITLVKIVDTIDVNIEN